MGTEHVERPTATGLITETSPLVIAGSAFVLGLTTGLCLPRVFRQLRGYSGRMMSKRGPQETIVYSENLPASLARREPAPDAEQPRYGGTGALGVSPHSVDRALGRVESPDPSPR